jgi:hypothetical protein
VTDSTKQRWVIDSIEEFMASIEVDGSRMMVFPQWILPSGAKQGDVLAVHHSRPADGKTSVLTIEVDEKATKATMRRSQAQVAKFADQPNDPGGDIAL